MADKKKTAEKREPSKVDKKARLLVDIKALPVVKREIVNRRTIDLIRLSDVVDLVNETL